MLQCCARDYVSGSVFVLFALWVILACRRSGFHNAVEWIVQNRSKALYPFRQYIYKAATIDREKELTTSPLQQLCKKKLLLYFILLSWPTCQLYLKNPVPWVVWCCSYRVAAKLYPMEIPLKHSHHLCLRFFKSLFIDIFVLLTSVVKCSYLYKDILLIEVV